MLSDVHEALKIDSEIDPKLVKTLIARDAPWALAIKYSGLLKQPEPNPPVVREVFEILEMWVSIQNGYDRLPDEDKAKIEQRDTRFLGFDGNNERDHLSVAYTTVNYLDLYPDLKMQVVDSHSRTLHKHRKMLEVYGSIRSEQCAKGSYDLSAQQILNLTQA
jgi:hypothetical protein